MAALRLGIDRMATRVRGVGPDPERWRLRMDRIMRGPLPTAMGQAAETALGGMEGVIRLRRLSVQLRPAAGLSDSALADVLGRQLADAMRRAIEGGGDTLRRWPDRASYAASYALRRLGLSRDPGWAFPDFAALDHLPGEEAALQALAPFGVMIWPALGQSEVAPNVIAAALSARHWDRLLKAPQGGVAMTEDALDRAILAITETDFFQGAPFIEILIPAILRNFRAQVPGDYSGQSHVAGQQFWALLAVAALRALWVQGLTSVKIAQVACGEIPPPMPLPATALEALENLSRDPVQVERVVARMVELGSVPPPQKSDKIKDPARSKRPGDSLTTPYAGLALCVGVILPEVGHPPEALRRIALHLVDDTKQAWAEQDPGFNLIFPGDPRIAVPSLPPPDPDLWTGQGTLGATALRDGYGLWADLWMARLAARLPGLRDSSRGYLRREFLMRPGRVIVNGEATTVRLAALPLGIVLQMSGLIGPVRFGDRLFLIELER